MISLCTVTISHVDEYLNILLKSILDKSKLISEILICDIGATETYEDKWNENNISFIRFGHVIKNKGLGHPIGLHECIERSTNEYIFTCDPDIFFKTSVDEIYLKLFEKYDLNYIGCSHPAAVAQANTFFPNVVNAFSKKSELPTPDFLKGRLKFRTSVFLDDWREDGELADGYYLLAGPIQEFASRFPNQDENARYDTGINLYLWALEQNWKWIAFQTTDCHNYATNYYRGNIKIKDKLPKAKLIYHATSSMQNLTKSNFLEAYKEFEGENDD